MRYLITGGAGFIGSHLARSLVAEGEDVRVLDDFSTGSLDNLSGIEGVEIISGDVRGRTTVDAAMDDIDVVFHLAALPSVARSVADPLQTHSVNVDGTLNVLTAAQEGTPSRLILASSSSIYGNNPTLPKHEDMPTTTLSPYAASKASAESYCRAFARVYDLETISLRFFNVFGPRQDPNSEYAAVIPRFVTSLIAGRPPVIFGDGTQSRDFTYIGNVVHACKLAVSAPREAVGEAFNVGCGARTTLLELVQRLNRFLATDIPPEHEGSRRGDVMHSLASIDKASKLLGYHPVISVDDGLRKTTEWFVSTSLAAA